MIRAGSVDGSSTSMNLEANSTKDEQVTGDGNKVGCFTRLEYAAPSLALATVGVMVSTFVPKLYSDTYNVQLKTIGWISLAALIVDALSDPIIGFASDYTRSRFGRRRPFIVLGGIAMGFVTFGLLSPPSEASESVLVAWASIFIVLIMLSSTMLRVPWLALGLELTSGSHDEKTPVFATREVVWILGTIIAAGLPLVLDGIEDEQQRFRIIAVVVCAVTVATSLTCAFSVREPRYEDLPERDSDSFCGGLARLFRSYTALFSSMWRGKDSRALLIASTLYGSASALNSFFFAYFIEYGVDAEDKLEVVLIIYILTGVCCIPLWVKLSKHAEKYTLLKGSMTLQSVVLLVAFFSVDHGDEVLYMVLVALAGMSFGAFSVFKFSMIGDLADADEWQVDRQNATRREGEIQGLFDLCNKLLSAALIGPALVVLDAFGYNPNSTQSDSSLTAIRVFYALVPSCFGILAVIVLMSYRLSREKHAQLKAEFEQRKNAT